MTAEVRRTNVLGWLRRRFGRLGGIGEAVSYAATGTNTVACGQPDSWLRRSAMPSAVRARRAARRHVV